MKRNTEKQKRLSQEKLKTILNYNSGTGIFTWNLRPGWSNGINSFNTKYGNKRAGYVHRTGYRYIAISGIGTFAETELVFLYINNEWPSEVVDHINGITDDNRLVNLRAVTQLENCQNRKKNKNNTTGFSCIWKRSDNGIFRVVVRKKGKRYEIGNFADLESAIAARDTAIKKIKGNFIRP